MPRQATLNLMILGARRCGTTSLGYYLMEHPEVYHVTYKDFDAIGGLKVNYPYNIPFSTLSSRQSILERYRQVTPERPRQKDPARVRYILNRAVYAIYFPHVLFHLAEQFPDLRILLSLRNPVDSIFSVYKRWRERSDGAAGTFEESFLQGIDFSEPPGNRAADQVSARIRRSVYLPGIEMIYRLFPREQIHAVTFHDLTRRTDETMRGICRFLDVDEGFEFTRLSVVRGLTEKPTPMSPAARSWLEALYEPYNQRLFELLGWPADTWAQREP